MAATLAATTTATMPASVLTPDSPPRRQQRRRKPRDPFLDLPDASDSSRPTSRDGRPPGTSSSFDGTHDDDDASSSLLNTLIYMPLAAVSFIVSLTLVEYRNRRYRARQHADHSATWFARLVDFFDPEPYARHRSPTKDVASLRRQDTDSSATTTTTSGDEAAQTGRRRWFATKKRSAMARMQVGDALEMRGRVAALLVFAVVLGLIGSAWGVSRLFGRVRRIW